MEQLGIQPLQLLTQIFNFVLMVVLLSKFLYKPILKVLDARRKKIAEGLEYTQKMQKEIEKNEIKREEILSKAKDEARRIIDEGKLRGKQKEEEIIKKAQEEASILLTKGREELNAQRQELEKDLRSKTVDIAQNWVEAVLSKVLDTKTQQTIINKKIRDLLSSGK